MKLLYRALCILFSIYFVHHVSVNCDMSELQLSGIIVWLCVCVHACTHERARVMYQCSGGTCHRMVYVCHTA
jgi:hypothetical protein